MDLKIMGQSVTSDKNTPVPVLSIKVAVTEGRFSTLYLQNNHIHIAVHTVI